MITVQVVGIDTVVARMRALPGEARKRLRPVMEKLGADFVAYVKSNKLSGDPLRNRTGTLRRSVNYRVNETGDSITVVAGTRNVPYAAYHEFGFHGDQNVRAHTRNVTQVFGRPWVGAVNVRAFTRHVDYAGRPFMRPSLQEYRPQIIERIRQAVPYLVRE